MKSFPVVAIACVAVLGACSVKEERVVQQPAPAASTVVTPVPASNAVVYTSPAPASTTTVYTR